MVEVIENVEDEEERRVSAPRRALDRRELGAATAAGQVLGS